jgi:hypothetical protein
VYAAYLRTARYRSVCEKALTRLFDDESEKVRSEASKCFYRFEGEELGQYARLIEDFILSTAFAAEQRQLIYALNKTTAELPEVTVLACARFLDFVGQEAAEIRTASAGLADDTVQILVRTYNQSRSSETQAQCLDLFDRMAQLGVYGVERALDQYER